MDAELEEWQLEELEAMQEEEERCSGCVWWMDIADHSKEYYPEYACCAPRFDLCCRCLSQEACVKGELKDGCVYGE